MYTEKYKYQPYYKHDCDKIVMGQLHSLRQTRCSAWKENYGCVSAWVNFQVAIVVVGGRKQVAGLC